MRIGWLSGRWRSCPRETSERSWIWQKNVIGTFQVECMSGESSLLETWSNNSYGLDLSIRGRMWCQASQTVRNLLGIDTKILTASGLCDSVAERKSTKSEKRTSLGLRWGALIFFLCCSQLFTLQLRAEWILCIITHIKMNKISLLKGISCTFGYRIEFYPLYFPDLK